MWIISAKANLIAQYEIQKTFSFRSLVWTATLVSRIWGNPFAWKNERNFRPKRSIFCMCGHIKVPQLPCNLLCPCGHQRCAFHKDPHPWLCSFFVLIFSWNTMGWEMMISLWTTTVRLTAHWIEDKIRTGQSVKLLLEGIQFKHQFKMYFTLFGKKVNWTKNNDTNFK